MDRRRRADFLADFLADFREAFATDLAVDFCDLDLDLGMVAINDRNVLGKDLNLWSLEEK